MTARQAFAMATARAGSHGLGGMRSPAALAHAISARAEVLDNSLHAASAAAAITCTRRGADPPATPELRHFLSAEPMPAGGR
jgi:hypothetical protein